MTHTPDKRYEQFGWDYEQVNPLEARAVHWYATWAGRTGGPVLELACGTGRLLCELVASGLDVTGVDLSESMLAIAGSNIERLPANDHSRAHLVRTDMAEFDLPGEFATIIIADNSFRELPTRADLLGCLRCLRRHLAPGGRVLITERKFNEAYYPGGRRTFDWSRAKVHPVTGEAVSRRIEVNLSADRHRISGEMAYRTRHTDGSETIEQCPFSSVVLRTDEYMELFAEAGLAARVFADYDEAAAGDEGAILCFVLQPH